MRMPRWLHSFLYGSPTALVAMPPTQEIAVLKEQSEARGRSSLIFDSHIMTEAASSKNPQAVSLAWDEGRAYGFNVAPQSWMGMTPRERKETLLSIYIANPWASNCIDSIALYITSGGLTIEPRVEKPDERQRDEIEEFLRRINEDWDFNQYVYDMLTDEMIFGEAFTEYTMKGGKPYQLFSIDNLTMDTEHDKYGMTTRYKQQLTSTSQVNYLDPKTIIRWWNPHKRAKVDPFSPLEGIQDAILQDKKMVNWTTTFFQKGAKFPFSIEGITDQDEADRYITWFKANYTGEKNAQTPIVLWGGAKLVPSGKGSIDIDFDKGLDRQQAIVLANFHVPPAIACISETGNRLTDMSDSQRKILQYIACDPRRNKFFEKFNYRLITPFWPDYYVSSRYADFRDDEKLAKVADMRVRNGTRLIDEVRQEEGKDPYPDGVGQVPVIVVTRDVIPVPRLKDLEDEQRQGAEVALDQAKANADLAQTKAKQAKEPQEPLQKGQQGVTPNATEPPPKPKKQPEDGEEEALRAALESYSAGAPLVRQPRSAEDIAHDLELQIQQAEDGSEAKTMLEMMLRIHRRQNPSYPRFDRAAIEAKIQGIPIDDDEAFIDMLKESREEQETNQESHEANDVQPGSDQDQGDESLHPVQKPLGQDGSSIDRGSATAEGESTSVEGNQHGEEGTQSQTQENRTSQSEQTAAKTKKADQTAPCDGIASQIDDQGGDRSQSSEDARRNRGPRSAVAVEPDSRSAEGSGHLEGMASNESRSSEGREGHQVQNRDDITSQTHDADQSKAELASWIAALFQTVKERGATSSPTLATAASVYTLNDQEQAELAQKLAEANVAAQRFAYGRDMVAVGLVPQIEESLFSKVGDLISWGREQVASIASTMQEMLTNFISGLSADAKVAEAVGGWIDRYADYKAPQIANVTWGAGANDGSMQAIEDIVEAAKDPSKAVSQDQVRVKVVPNYSSADFCADYAGHDYSIPEYLQLGVSWPAHPNCRHSIEIQKAGGDEA